MMNTSTTARVAALCVAAASTVTLAGGGEPCCTVKSINTRAATVTVAEKGTSCSYEFKAKTAKDLEGLSVGADISLDLSHFRGAVRPGGRDLGSKAPSDKVNRPTRPTPGEPVARPGGASSSRGVAATGTTSCGSNVSRNAKTKTLCRVMTGPNSWEYRPC